MPLPTWTAEDDNNEFLCAEWEKKEAAHAAAHGQSSMDEEEAHILSLAAYADAEAEAHAVAHWHGAGDEEEAHILSLAARADAEAAEAAAEDGEAAESAAEDDEAAEAAAEAAALSGASPHATNCTCRLALSHLCHSLLPSLPPASPCSCCA